MNYRCQTSRAAIYLAAFTGLGAGVVATSAAAQTAAQGNTSATAQTAQSPAVEEIIVTGSHIQTPGFTSPTPVTAMTNEQLTELAPSTVADALRTLPALSNLSGPQRNPGTANGGQSFLNLRSLGTSRTLTLLDGHRFVAGALTGSVDVNLIPASVVQRTDIVTGGASAAYGSDAVAGVVNFVLDRHFTGFKAEASAGISGEGDNKLAKVTASYGRDFANDRGHVIISGEYYNGGKVRPEDRRFSSRGCTLINGPAGGPTQIEACDVRVIDTYGGLILNGNGGTAAANAALGGIAFDGNGNTIPYNFGTYRTTTQQIGGDGVRAELIQELQRPLERKSVFGRAEYDIADAATVYLEGTFGNSASDYVNAYNRHQPGNTLTIQRDNAFLPQTIRNQMVASNVSNLTFVRYSRDRGFVHTNNDVDTKYGVVGVEGRISGWKWDAFYTRGRTNEATDILNVENVPRFTQAIDAVVRPSDGRIVCRSTLTNPTDGCVPFNPFGENQASNAALDYVLGTSSSVSILDLQNAGANVSGTVSEGWAGPISFATGAEWRKESAKISSDPFSQQAAYLFGNPLAWGGSYTVKEAYAETQVPLLSGAPLATSLDVNAAARVADYSTSGTIWAWKLGTSYAPIDGLRFRGTLSRDIRAPNVSDLFSAGRQATASPSDPFKGGAIALGTPSFSSGNPDLKPEIGHTAVIGVVAQPSAIPGLQASLDYYWIKIDKAIATIAAQQLLDQCYAGNQLACQQTVRDSTGKLIRINTIPINLNSLKADGADLEVSYTRDAGNLLGADTRMTVRGILSYTAKSETTVPGSPPIDRAAEVGQLAGSAQVSLATDVTTAFLQVRYIGGGKYDAARGPSLVSLQHVSPIAYMDGRVGYKPEPFNGGVEVYLDVRNILNEQPPFSPGAGNNPTAVNTIYDLIGRMFQVGVRLKY